MTLGRSPKLFFAGLAVLVLTTSYLGVQRGADPETRFRDALHKQQVEGDLNGAMEIYREIVASPNAGRAVKAKALLQLAGSLETLGKQAETVYQRILKEFEDQPAASQARSRLAALKSSAPAALTLTQIRFGATVQNVVATDGQRAVYWDPERTTLYIGDVAGRSRTRIFTTTAQRRPRAEVSRDLSMVFLYFVATGSKASTSYAIIRTDGSGSYREVDLKDKRFDLSLPLYGVSWSFDNRYIVLCKMGEDRIVRPLRLSVDDGQMTELLPGHPTSIGSAVLSPDGRSIALQGLIAGGVFQDVYVKPMQGGELERAAELSILADWTSDGRHLVFASQQNQGPPAMSMIPVSNGRVAGARTLIQGGLSIAVTDLIRPVTSANALIFAAASNRGARRVFHSVLDAQDRLSEWTELKTPIGRGAMPTFPVMSPDGARFAYRFGSLGGPPVPGRGAGVRVQNMTTGEDKVLFMSDGPIFNCVWSSMLYCGQPLTAEGKTAILSIDTTTGRSETLASFPGIRTTDSVSNDGRYLVMFGLSGPTAFSRWEIGTPQEGPGLPNGPYPSADGRWAFRAGPDSNNRWEFQIRPATAAEDAWEHLTYHRKQAADARDVVALKFTADGNWIVYHDVDTNGKDALFRLRTTGGEPQRLGDYPTSSPNSYLSVSADGRHILVETSPINPTSAEGLQTDYWILQNFLPNAVTAAPKN